MTELTAPQITQDLVERYQGIVKVQAWGETSLFYNPDQLLPRGVYFATVKEKDGENDRASLLKRDNVFRVNIGTTKPLFTSKFGPPPARPSKGGIVEGPWNFMQLNQLTPHPIYGWMCWVSVLNPSLKTYQQLKPFIDAAYGKAVTTFRKRIK